MTYLTLHDLSNVEALVVTLKKNLHSQVKTKISRNISSNYVSKPEVRYHIKILREYVRALLPDSLGRSNSKLTAACSSVKLSFSGGNIFTTSLASE